MVDASLSKKLTVKQSSAFLSFLLLCLSAGPCIFRAIHPCFYKLVLVLSRLPRLFIVAFSPRSETFRALSPHPGMPPQQSHPVSVPELPRPTLANSKLVQMDSQACLGQMACAPLEMDPRDATQSSIPLSHSYHPSRAPQPQVACTKAYFNCHHDWRPAMASSACWQPNPHRSCGCDHWRRHFGPLYGH